MSKKRKRRSGGGFGKVLLAVAVVGGGIYLAKKYAKLPAKKPGSTTATVASLNTVSAASARA